MSPEPTLILAPLRGATEDIVRRAFDRCFGGFDRAIAPFLTPMGRGGPRASEIRRAGRAAAASLPTTAQLLTADAADFLVVTRRLADAGCTEVNWNLGCPHKPVVHKGRGAGMLVWPERIEAFLDQVVPASPVPLSVKMRLGLDRLDQGLAVLEMLDRYPLTEVTLHARLGVQMYRGQVDLDGFAACLEATRHPLVYNGDICDLERFQSLHQRFPEVAGWMIGRGALRDPFLPARIKGVELDDRVGRLRRFHDQVFEVTASQLSGAHQLDRMKGLWVYIGEAAGADRRLLKKLRKARTPAAYHEVVAQILGDPRP